MLVKDKRGELVEDLEARVEEEMSRAEAMQTQLTDVLEAKDQLEEQLQEERNTVEDLKGELNDNVSTLEELSKDVEETRSTMAYLKEQYELSLGTVEGLRAQLSEEQDRGEELGDIADAKERQIEAMQEREEQLNEELRLTSNVVTMLVLCSGILLPGYACIQYSEYKFDTQNGQNATAHAWSLKHHTFAGHISTAPCTPI